MRFALSGLVALGVLVTSPAVADLFQRNQPATGSVISRKVGEEVRFIDVADWRGVDVKQDLLAGDVLRTNATGSLAILFSDRTQMRLGRNTTLLVKAVGDASDSAFSLQSGTLWGRAERGGAGLTVETAAATAAIRGTDFSLAVGPDGRTSLIVLEGVVDLTNEFGSVTVAQGEAAAASIGSAPTKIVIVDPVDREQMLFHLSLRNSFSLLPASPLPARGMREERNRILAIPAGGRTAEDRVMLAETSLSHDGPDEAQAALVEARQARLSRAQAARLDLVEAMLAGSDGRYDEAAGLFSRARRGLSGPRRTMADYGGYFARALADPGRVETPPSGTSSGPYGVIAEAWTAGFLKDIPAAIAVLRRGEARYPDDPTLPAVRAQFAMLIDDREQVQAAIDRSLALDPDDATALEARANYRANYLGDLKGARTDLEQAAKVAPGSSSIWNALGLVLSARGATTEAEAALKRSIALDPGDPVGYANLAILYLDQDRVAEAKVQIDKAIAVDPSFDIALVARGRYHLQIGELDKAREDLLAGTTANPGYSQGLLLLAGAHYESGDLEPAAQAIDNADRLDPNDPVTANFRTAIAIDDYDADGAIRNAQEALKRTRARGGDYAALSANKDAGSTLNDAYRLAGLDAWGRYYGDAVFDPFGGAGYVDRTLGGSVDPFFNRIEVGGVHVEPTPNVSGFSSFIQGLALDPAMISGRSRSANLFRRPFLEGSLGGGFVSADGDLGWMAEAEVQGYLAAPVPWSFYGKLNARVVDEYREGFSPGVPIPTSRFTLEDDDIAGTGYITARPTPDDRIVAYLDYRRETSGLRDAIFVLPQPIPLPIPGLPGVTIVGTGYDREVEQSAGIAGLVWSHSFGYRNVANVGVFGTSVSGESTERGVIVLDFLGFPFGGTVDDRKESEQQSYLVGANHILGLDDLTVRYGLEGGQLDYRQSSIQTITTIGPPDVVRQEQAIDLAIARAYVDLLWDVSPTVQLEAGLFPVRLSGALDRTNLDPRVGAAWSPVEGHWLRAGYISETSAGAAATLAPIGLLGLQANQLPLLPGGRTDTFAARWEAEWSSRLFTAIDYQHQDARNLSIGIPGSVDTYDIAEGRIDRVSGTANLWLGAGFSLTGTIAHAETEDRDPASIGFGRELPFIPETSGRIGLTWVNPANVKATIAATYAGTREGNQAGTRLEDYWTVDAFLTWEPFDKRFALELAAYNIFDEAFEVAPQVPGWGPTVTGSLKVRF